MIEAMMEAGRLARQASGDNRVVEVFITELGLIVAGRDGQRAYSTDLGWPEFERHPALLANSVRLVAAHFGVAGLPG